MKQNRLQPPLHAADIRYAAAAAIHLFAPSPISNHMSFKSGGKSNISDRAWIAQINVIGRSSSASSFAETTMSRSQIILFPMNLVIAIAVILLLAFPVSAKDVQASKYVPKASKAQRITLVVFASLFFLLLCYAIYLRAQLARLARRLFGALTTPLLSQTMDGEEEQKQPKIDAVGFELTGR